jgi:hypothetical protein
MKTLLLAAALAVACAFPAFASAADGWCHGPVCVATCTAGETACLDPDACRSGDPDRLGECVDVDRYCLHVGEPCGPPT